MEKTETKAMPKNYSVCIQTNCAVADKCLRHLAFEEQSKTYKSMTVLNPNGCTQDANCPNFRDSEPQRFARGFTNMEEHMYPRQHRIFKRALISNLGRCTYYRRRCGELDLTPEEQKLVTNALKKAGVTETLDFDSYDYHSYWK